MTTAPRTAFLALSLALALAAAPALADDASLARCGAAKVTALARACGPLLASEARFRGDGDGAARDQRRALIDGRVRDAWARAESDASDARCAAYAAAAPDAASRLPPR
ncbi:MAG: hypothetical protein U0802_22105 [Candidatus Binatia bacterium]